MSPEGETYTSKPAVCKKSGCLYPMFKETVIDPAKGFVEVCDIKCPEFLYNPNVDDVDDITPSG